MSEAVNDCSFPTFDFSTQTKFVIRALQDLVNKANVIAQSDEEGLSVKATPVIRGVLAFMEVQLESTSTDKELSYDKYRLFLAGFHEHQNERRPLVRLEKIASEIDVDENKIDPIYFSNHASLLVTILGGY